jgi:hypothetical protein
VLLIVVDDGDRAATAEEQGHRMMAALPHVQEGIDGVNPFGIDQLHESLDRLLGRTSQVPEVTRVDASTCPVDGSRSVRIHQRWCRASRKVCSRSGYGPGAPSINKGMGHASAVSSEQAVRFVNGGRIGRVSHTKQELDKLLYQLTMLEGRRP